MVIIPDKIIPPEKLLPMLQKCELWIAELYHLCAEIWEEDKDFWKNMETEEIKHFEKLKKMEQIYYDHPSNFKPGRTFREIAIQSMIENVKLMLPEIKSGKIPRKRIFAIARGIEESIIESKYNEIFSASDYRYEALAKEIAVDTYKHKKLLLSKMEELEKE
jgi:hypothetical protein